MGSAIPHTIPPCAANLLARREWFSDPGVVGRAQLAEASTLARFLSNPLFARQQIAAITLGHTIHFRQTDSYNPHSTDGLAFLAHELKHVEQYERDGPVKFYAKYVWAYLFHGYGASIPFEGEAAAFQSAVAAHLATEFETNRVHPPV